MGIRSGCAEKIGFDLSHNVPAVKITGAVDSECQSGQNNNETDEPQCAGGNAF